MGLRRTPLPVQHVPPVVVSVIDPLPSSVSDDFHSPRTARVFGLVVHTGQKLVHVFVRVIDVVRTVVGLPEFVDRVHRPVAAVFIVGGSSRFLPTETSAVAYGSLSVPVGSGLGGNEDHTESGTRSVDCGSGCILDNRNGCHVIRVEPVKVTGITGHTVDNDQRLRRVDRIRTSDVDRA